MISIKTDNVVLKNILIGLLLAALTFSAFDLILDNGFILYDDPGYVTENTHVLQGLTLNSIAWAFHTTFTGNWIPITWMSHMLDVELYGTDPAGHHLDSLILHIANVLLVFALFQITTKKTWAAALAAALFAIHPLRVESVAWVSERKDVLSGFFGLSACITYVLYTKCSSGGKRVFFYGFTFILLTLGLMSKAMLVTWPFLFLVLDFWPLKRFRKISRPRLDGNLSDTKDSRLWIEKIPFLLLAGLFSIIAYYAQNQQGAVQTFESSPLNLRLANVIVSYGRYLEKIFWPRHLALLYPLNLDIVAAGNVIISSLILLIISVLCIVWKNKRPYLLTGWLWFLGTLVPVIGLVQIGAQSIADRYTYLPSIGISLIVAFGLRELWGKGKVVRLLIVLLLSAMMITMLFLTWMQCARWKNSITIFGYTVQVTDNNYIMQTNYAYAFLKADKLDDALREYQTAAQMRPDSSEPPEKLGEVCIQQGRYQQAVEYLRQAIRKNKDLKLEEAYNNLGIAYARQSKLDRAITYFEKSLQIDPDNSETLSNIASAYRDSHQYPRAVESLHKALVLDPDAPVCLNKLAELYLIKDSQVYDPKAALQDAEKACILTHFNNPKFLETLSISCLETGNLGRAEESVNQALKLLPPQQHDELRNRLQALQQKIFLEKNRK